MSLHTEDNSIVQHRAWFKFHKGAHLEPGAQTRAGAKPRGLFHFIQLYFTKHGSTEKINIINKHNILNEHTILRKRKVDSKFMSVTAYHISHDIIDYLMHRIY